MRTPRIGLVLSLTASLLIGSSLTATAQESERDLSCYAPVQIDGIFAPGPGEPTLPPCEPADPVEEFTRAFEELRAGRFMWPGLRRPIPRAPDLSCYDSIAIDGIFAPKPGQPTLKPCHAPGGPEHCAGIAADMKDRLDFYRQGLALPEDEYGSPEEQLRQLVLWAEQDHLADSGWLGAIRSVLRSVVDADPECMSEVLRVPVEDRRR